MAKKVGNKYFLEAGDLVSVNSGTLEYTDGPDCYKVSDLSDATLNWYDEKEETDYEVTYAWDLSQDDENYGKPYFEKD